MASEDGVTEDTTLYAKWVKSFEKSTINFETFKKSKLHELNESELFLFEILIENGQFEYKELEDYVFALYTKSGKLVMKRNGETLSYGNEFSIEDNILYTLTAEDKENLIKAGYDFPEKIELIFVEDKKEEKLPENPKTFDGVGTSIFIGILSFVELVGATIYLKKKNKVKA